MTNANKTTALTRGQCFISGNDKGGVGKDLIAEGLHMAAHHVGLSATLVEVETSKRLGQLYPEAISIPLDVPTPQDVYTNPDVVFTALDRLGELMNREGGVTIVSLGANVTSALLAWGAAHGSAMLGGGERLTFVVSLSMNRHAMASGLSNLYDIHSVFPKARRVAIKNDIHAAFMDGDQFLARRLEEARGAGRPIDTIALPRCAAPAWGYAQNFGSLAEIAALDPQKLIDLGLPEGPVRRSMMLITQWIAESLVKPLSVLLPKVEVPRASRKAGA
jgi:hypothetical protein